MTPKLHECAGRVQFGVIEKPPSACYFKITRETMLLLVNGKKGNIRNKNTGNTTVFTWRSLPFTFSLKTLNLRPYNVVINTCKQSELPNSDVTTIALKFHPPCLFFFKKIWTPIFLRQV